ncbi:MAG UNVERIFIED_CONTAM: transposase [Microcystis novacekii LVE1205-3]
MGGKKALNVREWECLFCGTFHDRDVNPAINIKVAGDSRTLKMGVEESVRLLLKKRHPVKRQPIRNSFN